MPGVSIVLPTLNSERYLKECLVSCLSQSYEDIEIIVVDGGSKDNTMGILREYQRKDARITIFDQPDNTGKLPGALNLGFSKCKGDCLTWMQSDSLYTVDAIQSLKLHLDTNPDVDFVFANYWIIGADSMDVIEAIEVGPIDQIKYDNPVGMCHLWRRKVYEKIGDHDVGSYLAEDYDYWCRTYQAGFKMEQVNQYLYYWRRHQGSLTYNNYGLFAAQRKAAQARKRSVNRDPIFFLRSISKSYIDEAFVRRLSRDIYGMRLCVLRGLLYNPAWVFNRGVLSLLYQSVTGRIKAPSSKLSWPPQN